MLDFTESFYHQNAQSYAELNNLYIRYSSSSHPKLNCDLDLLTQFIDLIIHPSQFGLDAGCGAGARDVFWFWQAGYQMFGLDSVEENLFVSKKYHPEIKDALVVHDLRTPLPFINSCFGFVICNFVIQHIAPVIVETTVVPELARILITNGVLLLTFKRGQGITTVYDHNYGVQRSFQLYEENNIMPILEKYGLKLIPANNGGLGGFMYFIDYKGVEHCSLYAQKFDA